MKRALIAVVVLAVLLVGTLFIAPSFVDWNKYKQQIIAQLEGVTGYNFEIGGALEMAVLPTPHLSIENLTISKPDTAGEPLARLDAASVQLALAPLFSGNVEVSKIQLINPDFRLSVGADGKQSWMTPELQEKMGKEQGGESSGRSTEIANAIALNAITIKNGAFTFTDQRTGKTVSLKDVNLAVQGESLYGPYSVEGGVNYNGTKTLVKINSGRLDKLADSIAAQLELSFPDMASAVTYSGVVALKDKLELQGETGIKTPDLAKLLKVAGVDAPAYLQKPASTKGILTVSGNEAAYRNLNVGFAGLEGAGYVVVANFDKNAKGPLRLEVNLETKPFVLEKLLPASAAAGKSGAEAGKKADTFLPETITVPKEISGAINIKSAAVTYGGVTYSDVAFNFESREKDFGGQLNLKAPGGTTLDLNSGLVFGARTKSPQDGSVTYSEPSLKLETKLASAEPLKLAASYMKTPPEKSLANLLANNLASEANLTVRPRQVDIGAAFVKLGETRFNASGTYKKNSGQTRDILKIAISNFGLDADYWMKKIDGTATAAVAPVATKPGTKPDVRSMTKNLVLPFDLDYTAEIQSLRLKGRDYTKLASKGKLMGKQFLLDSLQMTSNSGDTLVVAGGVRDVATLGGIDLSMDANIVDLEQTVKSFGMDPARLPAGIGQSQLLAELKGEPEKLAFTTNLKAMRGSMEAAGVLADVLGAPKVSDLTLRLQHPNYVDLARIYNPSFNSGVGIKKNLDIFASMSRKDNVYTFSQLQALVGPTSIKGDVVADVSGAKPAITAALVLTDVPVDALLGIQTSKGTIKAQTSAQAATSDVRWSRNAINTDFLQKANIALKATADSVSYGNWNFRNAGVNIDLKDGNVDIKQLDGGAYGGHVAMTGALKSSPKPRQPISFAGNFIVQNVALEEFVRSFSGSQLVKAKGPVSLTADIKTSGLSPAALIFDLSGKGTASGQNLVFEGFDLAQLSRALAEPSSSFTQNFSRLLDASLKGGSTRFDTLDGAYTITEGVIKFDKMLLTGPEAAIATLGTISLPLWTLDLESVVQLKEPADAPPLRASFKGPIDKPAQTFGQNAMQQFFQKQLEGLVVNPLLESLEKKGVLPDGFVGGTQKTAPVTQQVQPQGTNAQTAPTTPAEGTTQIQPKPAPPQPVQEQPSETTPAEPQPQAVQKPKEVKPEDIFFGILQEVVKGQ